MAKCDICGETTSIHDMESLRDSYQLPNVKDMCRTCTAWADDQLWKIREGNAVELKRRIAKRVAARVGPKPRRWWQFLTKTAAPSANTESLVAAITAAQGRAHEKPLNLD